MGVFSCATRYPCTPQMTVSRRWCVAGIHSAGLHLSPPGRALPPPSPRLALSWCSVPALLSSFSLFTLVSSRRAARPHTSFFFRHRPSWIVPLVSPFSRDQIENALEPFSRAGRARLHVTRQDKCSGGQEHMKDVFCSNFSPLADSIVSWESTSLKNMSQTSRGQMIEQAHSKDIEIFDECVVNNCEPTKMFQIVYN